jgi:hypothetical protein
MGTRFGKHQTPRRSASNDHNVDARQFPFQFPELGIGQIDKAETVRRMQDGFDQVVQHGDFGMQTIHSNPTDVGPQSVREDRADDAIVAQSHSRMLVSNVTPPGSQDETTHNPVHAHCREINIYFCFYS